MDWALIATLFVGGAALFAVVGTLIARRLIRASVTHNHNDVLAPIFLTAGVIYAVLLGFLVVSMWGSYDYARTNTAEEASLLVPLYRQTMDMAPPQGAEMRALIRHYASHAAAGWSRFQTTRQGSTEARRTVDEMLKVFDALAPTTKAAEINDTEFYRTLSLLLLDRDKRLNEAAQALSWIMWLAAVGGGVITVGMSFVLYMERPVPHVVMTTVLSVMIGAMLLIMALLNHPFSGPVAIGPEPFQAALTLFDQIDGDFR
jgi:Protein of unknown function (DUF4239)